MRVLFRRSRSKFFFFRLGSQPRDLSSHTVKYHLDILVFAANELALEPEERQPNERSVAARLIN